MAQPRRRRPPQVPNLRGHCQETHAHGSKQLRPGATACRQTAAVRRHGRLSVRRRCSHGCRPPASRPSVPPRPSGLLPTAAHLNWANPLWDAGSCRRQVRCSCCSPWSSRGELPRTAPIGDTSTKPATLPRPPPPRAPPSAETLPAALLRGPPPSYSTSAVDACFFRMVSRPIALTQPRTSHAQNSPSSTPTHLTCTRGDLVVAGFTIAACRRRLPCCMPRGHGAMLL